LGEKWPKGLGPAPKSAGLGTVLMGWTVIGAGPVSSFSIFQEFPIFKYFPICKIGMAPKISKLCTRVYLIIVNNFSHWI
jgi:hypothetical protein